METTPTLLQHRLRTALRALSETTRENALSLVEAAQKAVETCWNDEAPNVPDEVKLMIVQAALEQGTVFTRGSYEDVFASRVSRTESLEIGGELSLGIWTADLTVSGGYNYGGATSEANMTRVTFDWVAGRILETVMSLLQSDKATVTNSLTLLATVLKGG